MKTVTYHESIQRICSFKRCFQFLTDLEGEHAAGAGVEIHAVAHILGRNLAKHVAADLLNLADVVNVADMHRIVRLGRINHHIADELRLISAGTPVSGERKADSGVGLGDAGELSTALGEGARGGCGAVGGVALPALGASGSEVRRGLLLLDRKIA